MDDGAEWPAPATRDKKNGPAEAGPQAYASGVWTEGVGRRSEGGVRPVLGHRGVGGVGGKIRQIVAGEAGVRGVVGGFRRRHVLIGLLGAGSQAQPGERPQTEFVESFPGDELDVPNITDMESSLEESPSGDEVAASNTGKSTQSSLGGILAGDETNVPSESSPREADASRTQPAPVADDNLLRQPELQSLDGVLPVTSATTTLPAQGVLAGSDDTQPSEPERSSATAGEL